MNSKKRLITFGCMTIITMIIIFCFSAQESKDSIEMSESAFELFEKVMGGLFDSEIMEFVNEYIRKMAHFVLYLILGVNTSLFVLEWKEALIGRRLALEYSWLFTVAYAITDEFHQKFVPGRSCEWRDVCIDGLGAFIGILIVLLIRIIKEKGLKKKS